jgi:ATP-dependent RNA helicase DDX28
LITCKNKEFNLYLDQKKATKPDDQIVLASKGWQHQKSKGDYFTIHATKSADNVLQNGTNFSELNLDKQLIKNLEEIHDITIATKLQTDAMKEIFNNQHVLLAAETGCGKVKLK